MISACSAGSWSRTHSSSSRAAAAMAPRSAQSGSKAGERQGMRVYSLSAGRTRVFPGVVDHRFGRKRGQALERLGHVAGNLGAHRSAFEQEALFVLPQVPALGDLGALGRPLELVAPDAPAEDLAERAREARLPGDAAVWLELHHRVGRRVGQTQPHRHAERRPEGQPFGHARLCLDHLARAVELGVACRIGDDGEDRAGRGTDDPLDAHDGPVGIALHDATSAFVSGPGRPDPGHYDAGAA